MVLQNLHLFGFNYERFLWTGGGFQRVRTHLYGSLLYYLQIAQRPDEPDTLEAGMVQLYYGKEQKKNCYLSLNGTVSACWVVFWK